MFKKIKTISLIYLIIFLGIIFLICSVSMNSLKLKQEPKKNIPNTIQKQNNNYLSSRENAVKEYLLSQKDFSWSTKENSQRKCVFINLDSNEIFPIAIWSHCFEYVLENGKIQELSGSSLPTLIDYPNELSFFNPLKMTHIIPRDGKYYSQDIKDIFSQTAQNKIFSKDFMQEIKDLKIQEIQK